MVINFEKHTMQKAGTKSTTGFDEQCYCMLSFSALAKNCSEKYFFLFNYMYIKKLY